jgi:hypothetical protein
MRKPLNECSRGSQRANLLSDCGPTCADQAQSSLESLKESVTPTEFTRKKNAERCRYPGLNRPEVRYSRLPGCSEHWRESELVHTPEDGRHPAVAYVEHQEAPPGGLRLPPTQVVDAERAVVTGE